MLNCKVFFAKKRLLIKKSALLHIYRQEYKDIHRKAILFNIGNFQVIVNGTVCENWKRYICFCQVFFWIYNIQCQPSLCNLLVKRKHPILQIWGHVNMTKGQLDCQLSNWNWTTNWRMVLHSKVQNFNQLTNNQLILALTKIVEKQQKSIVINVQWKAKWIQQWCLTVRYILCSCVSIAKQYHRQLKKVQNYKLLNDKTIKQSITLKG